MDSSHSPQIHFCIQIALLVREHLACDGDKVLRLVSANAVILLLLLLLLLLRRGVLIDLFAAMVGRKGG